jgi:serine/threonine protein kinase
MQITAGTRLGPYEVVSPIGSGGMGKVYRARDTRLDRIVAIKVLSAEFHADPDIRRRFEREARTISSLNHPHICTLYDIGRQNETDYLVLEYLEGQTLADRLAGGPLPIPQVLRFGIQIADALEKAHRHGIVHRDLKPGNIILTKSGVKMLDFGLAKAMPSKRFDRAAQDASTLPHGLPTASHSLTAEGALVGTFPYMSPEQLQGRDADARSDIFALGAVLYEMAAARRAFDGTAPMSVMAAILEREPRPLTAAQPQAPRALERLVKLCLAKDPDERWQTAHDLKLELDGILEDVSAAGIPALATRRRRMRENAGWAVAALLVALLLTLGLFRRPGPQPLPVRSSLLPPPNVSFLPYNFAISPDGSRLAFVALGPDGKTALWVRGLSSSSAQQLTGTEGASYPFWSPDSLRVGFFAEGRLKTIDLANSAVQTLCAAAPGFGGTWNQDGVIIFAPGITGPLYHVPAAGGTPSAVTKLLPNSTQSQHWPSFLPDGKHFLYFVNWSGPSNLQLNGLYTASLDSGATHQISSDIIGNVFFASGHLVYVHDRRVVGQPFDAGRLKTTGPPLPLTQQEVDKFFDFWQSGVSVSQDGKLVFQSAADAPSRLVWYDATGKEIGQLPEIGYEGPQFSPDGRALAVYSDDEHNGQHFIRVYDLARGISTRLTDGGHESLPVWSPDGKVIAFRDASLNIEEVPADASAPPRALVTGTNVIPCDWSRDGHLIYMSLEGGEFPSLAVYSPVDHKSTKFAKFGAEPQFSPDGKWVAYVRMPERVIAVRPFSTPGPHLQISNMSGSAQPRWSRDGRKVFFVQPDRKLMVVDFNPATFAADPPQVVAQTRITTAMFGWFQYAVAPDGRFLINSFPSGASSPLTLITGWTARLKGL